MTLYSIGITQNVDTLRKKMQLITAKSTVTDHQKNIEADYDNFGDAK